MFDESEQYGNVQISNCISSVSELYYSLHFLPKICCNKIYKKCHFLSFKYELIFVIVKAIREFIIASNIMKKDCDDDNFRKSCTD